MKAIVFFLLFFLFGSLVFGQANHYRGLLDTVSKQHHLSFVSSKPISKIGLDEKEMWNYFYFFRDYGKKVLDTIMFLKIIKNIKTADTTKWTDKELKGVVLVDSRDESIDANSFIRKFSLTDKRLIRYFKKQINQINSTAPFNKSILYLSRPIFDDSGRFAVIQWDNAHSGLGGGGRIVLYQFEGNQWKEVGAVMNWKY